LLGAKESRRGMSRITHVELTGRDVWHHRGILLRSLRSLLPLLRLRRLLPSLLRLLVLRRRLRDVRARRLATKPPLKLILKRNIRCKDFVERTLDAILRRE